MIEIILYFISFHLLCINLYVITVNKTVVFIFCSMAFVILCFWIYFFDIAENTLSETLKQGNGFKLITN